MSKHNRDAKSSLHIQPEKGVNKHPRKPHYKVEMRLLVGWSDAGWTIEYDSGPRPMRFSSREKAQAEIDELIADVKKAVEAGDMEDEYDPDDYRVVEVKP